MKTLRAFVRDELRANPGITSLEVYTKARIAFPQANKVWLRNIVANYWHKLRKAACP